VEVAHIERPGPKLKYKLFAVAAASALILYLAGLTPAHNEEKTPRSGGKVERSLAVDPQVTVTLCVASGVLTVHGWDKREVRVSSADAEQLDFRRIDKPADPATPASRIDVMVLDKMSRADPKLDCQAIADVEMYVPSGATVQVQTRDGDIDISGVAGAFAGSQNGDITIQGTTKLVEAGSVGGSISLRDSSGRINLSSAGGGVEVTNIRAQGPEDMLEVGTVSGDIQLEGIGSPKVLAKTVSGRLNMSGALVKSGYYSFTNVTGEIMLAMPPDASFRLKAKVSDKRDIDSEFTLKYLREPAPAAAPQVLPPNPQPPEVREPRLPAKEKEALKEKEKEKSSIKTAPPAKAPATPRTGPLVGPVTVERPLVIVPYVRRIDAICGSGDALILIASFGGGVHLKKL
jgi:putative adhesin